MTHDLSKICHRSGCRASGTAAEKNLIDAVAKSVNRAKAKGQAQSEKKRRMLEQNRQGDLRDWLKKAESDNGLACSAMRSIRHAEKICGRRLCISLAHGIVLSGKGFRLMAARAPENFGFFAAPWPSVERITEHRVRRRLDAHYHQASVKNNVKQALGLLDVKKSLLYMGVDEWPMYRKVLWGTMTGITLGAAIPLSFPHSFKHQLDYELALRPVMGHSEGLSHNTQLSQRQY